MCVTNDKKTIRVGLTQPGILTIDLIDIFAGLEEEERKILLELYTFEEILTSIEDQLKHNTDLSSWCTDGYRDGARLRRAILEIQGLEPEFKKDLESRISSLAHDVAHYRKYYDWYFKVYHLEGDRGERRVIDTLHDKIGVPHE